MTARPTPRHARAGPRRRRGRALGRERDDDGVRPEHRRGAGGHLPGLGALGVDEGHLLELERGLEGRRVAEPAAGDEQVLRAASRSTRARTSGSARRSRPPRGPRRRGSRPRPGRHARGPAARAAGARWRRGSHEKVLVMTGHDARAARREDEVRSRPGSAWIPGRGRCRPPARGRAALGDRDDVPELARRRDADDRVAGAERRRVGQELGRGQRDDDRVLGPACGGRGRRPRGSSGDGAVADDVDAADAGARARSRPRAALGRAVSTVARIAAGPSRISGGRCPRS